MRIQDAHFAVVKNSFPRFGAEVASAERGAQRQQQVRRPVLPPPSPTTNLHPRCFIPEVNVKHVMAAPSVVEEMWRCQSPGLWNGFMKLRSGHQSD